MKDEKGDNPDLTTFPTVCILLLNFCMSYPPPGWPWMMHDYSDSMKMKHTTNPFMFFPFSLLRQLKAIRVHRML